jgi:hypothetical protein
VFRSRNHLYCDARHMREKEGVILFLFLFFGSSLVYRTWLIAIAIAARPCVDLATKNVCTGSKQTRDCGQGPRAALVGTERVAPRHHVRLGLVA